MQRERDHLEFGIGAPHSVAVDHGNAGHRSDHERDGRIEAAGLRAQNRADLLAEEPLELAERGEYLLALRDLFDHHRRRAHHRAGNDEFVVLDLGDVDHAHLAVLADRLLGHQLADIGVPLCPEIVAEFANGAIGTAGANSA